MKTIPAAFQAMLDSGTYTIGTALLIRRADGQLFGFTSCIKPLVLDLTPWAAYGFTEDAFEFDYRQGLDVSTIVTTAGFEVDNMEITTLDDGSLFDRDDVLAGTWNGAAFLIFRYRWDVAVPTIANDVEPLMRGWFGEVTLNSTTIKIELRGLTQKLQQPVGIVSTKTCRARLGSTTGPNKCLLDLTPWTFTPLTVETVVDKRTFTFTGTLADDMLGEGLITWQTGNNAGVTQKVRSHTAIGSAPVTGGTVVLSQPMILPIQVGDTFTAVAGCRKRLLEDCRDKFNNVLNFQGEPHRPSLNELTKPV